MLSSMVTGNLDCFQHNVEILASGNCQDGIQIALSTLFAAYCPYIGYY